MTSGMSKAPKGFKKQVFGVVLMLFGAVNVTFNIKTDIPVDVFDLLLIVFGGGLFVFGSVQKDKEQRSTNQHD